MPEVEKKPTTVPALLGLSLPSFWVGLVMILVGITYGLQPSGGHNMGWASPWVLFEIIGGVALLGVTDVK